MNQVKEKLQDILAKIRALWESVSRRTRLIFLLSLVGVFVLIILLVIWLSHVNYVPVAGNLTPKESAELFSLLGEINVEPKVSSGGIIMVPEEDADRVLMQLNTRMTGGFGYEIYQNLGITATQSERNQTEIFLIQNRLQGMIESLDEVSQAIVQLSVPQPSIYALQGDAKPPTAAVQIEKRPGHELTAEQIQGIINTVKGAVSGLTEQNIFISDENGDLKLLLNAGGSNLTKLNLTEQVNSTIRSRVLSVLIPVFGEENVHVAVNSVLDIDQSTRQEITYIPHDDENPKNNAVDYEEIYREKIGGDDQVVAGVPGANDNVDVPQYSAEGLYLEDGDSYLAKDTIDYLVSSVREDIIKEGLEIVDVTVAVVINAETLPEGRKDQVIDLVVGAGGTVKKDGILQRDNVKVQNMRFWTDGGFDGPPGPDLRTVLLITGLLILALVIMFVIILLSVRKKRKKKEEERIEEEKRSLIDMMGDEVEYEPIQIVETQEQKLRSQIRDLATSDPEIVAQLVRTWLMSS